MRDCSRRNNSWGKVGDTTRDGALHYMSRLGAMVLGLRELSIISARN